MGEIAWAFDSEYFEFSTENFGSEGYGMNASAGNHKTLSQSFQYFYNASDRIQFSPPLLFQCDNNFTRTSNRSFHA